MRLAMRGESVNLTATLLPPRTRNARVPRETCPPPNRGVARWTIPLHRATSLRHATLTTITRFRLRRVDPVTARASGSGATGLAPAAGADVPELASGVGGTTAVPPSATLLEPAAASLSTSSVAARSSRGPAPT